MERETLVTLLIMTCGGLLLQLLAVWPVRPPAGIDPLVRERQAWRALCRPAVGLLACAAWFIGWALLEPDPVRDPLDPWVVVLVWLPFGVLFGRAVLRAVWSLVRELPDCGVSTFGLLQPRVAFSPYLARNLAEPVIAAALAHEYAHARHRDPLRIWLAQLITDLQWPWPHAQRRLRLWLEALEPARDAEARRHGIAGADLAAAMLASVRFVRELTPRQRAGLGGTQQAHAKLVADPQSLRGRVAQLLAPLPPATAPTEARVWGVRRTTVLIIAALLCVVLLGALGGQWVMRPLLALTT
jgi:hypothetical protein